MKRRRRVGISNQTLELPLRFLHCILLHHCPTVCAYRYPHSWLETKSRRIVSNLRLLSGENIAAATHGRSLQQGQVLIPLQAHQPCSRCSRRGMLGSGKAAGECVNVSKLLSPEGEE
jgi:hypothetical protein